MFKLRTWIKQADGLAFTGWKAFTAEPAEDDPVLLIHKIDIAWAYLSSSATRNYQIRRNRQSIGDR
jgi:hypothetical protein